MAMTKRISNISHDYLSLLVQKGIEVRLINNPLTDEPEYSSLKGVTPRGWEGTGETWDDIPGVAGHPIIVRIGYSEFNKGHGSLNLELHEIAHIIDYTLFQTISGSSNFKEIWQKEVVNLIKDHPNAGNMYYFRDYPEEYFAEAFVYYYLDNERKTELKQKAPLTYQFFEQLENGQPTPM